MASYQIISAAGQDMGTYEGATAREAVEAMWADAGVEGSDELFRELTTRDVTAERRETDLYERVLDGIEVEAVQGVVRVNDGVDEWYCWEREWDAMVERVRSGALRLPDGDDDSKAIGYGSVCESVRSPILSCAGTSRGTDAEQAELARAAAKAWTDDFDAARYGVGVE